MAQSDRIIFLKRGWRVSNIKTTCNTFVDFFIVKYIKLIILEELQNLYTLYYDPISKCKFILTFSSSGLQ